MSDLFAASGLDKSGPRPLADRLRPTTLAEVAGQEHLTGPDGALTRLAWLTSRCGSRSSRTVSTCMSRLSDEALTARGDERDTVVR